MDRGHLVDARHDRVVKSDAVDGALCEDEDGGELAPWLTRGHPGLDPRRFGFGRDADERALAVSGGVGVDGDGSASELRSRVLLGGGKEAVHVDVAVALGLGVTRRRTEAGRPMRVRLRHGHIVRPRRLAIGTDPWKTCYQVTPLDPPDPPSARRPAKPRRATRDARRSETLGVTRARRRKKPVR